MVNVDDAESMGRCEEARIEGENAENCVQVLEIHSKLQVQVQA